MTKRSNPKRSVPHVGREYDANEFARQSRQQTPTRIRKRRTMTPDMLRNLPEDTVGEGRHRGTEQLRSHRASRIEGANGSWPVHAERAPRPPAILVLHPELMGEMGTAPDPVYGQYPRGLIAKILPWLRCERHEILHVCSGCLPRGEGIRVDIRPAARPDILADGRNLPLRDGSIAAVMLDPPYSPAYTKGLYGVDEYPRPAHLMAEAARVVRPGGRIAFVHYITPKPPRGTRFVRAFGLSTGFDMPIRALSIFEKDQRGLSLGGC